MGQTLNRSRSAFLFVVLILAFAPSRAGATPKVFQIKVASASVQGPCKLDARFRPFTVTEVVQPTLEVCSASFILGDVIRISRNSFGGPWTELRVSDLPPGFVVLSAKVNIAGSFQKVSGACYTYAGSLCAGADPFHCYGLYVCFPPGTTINDLVGMTIGGHRYRQYPPDPDKVIFQALEWGSVSGTWDGPWPTTRSLRIRAALTSDPSSVQFLPAAGATLPTTARVPLGSTVALQAIDNNGALVPATFRLGGSTLQPNVDANALFPDEALHQYAPPALDQGLFQAVHLGSVNVTVTPGDASLPPKSLSVVVEHPLSLGDDASQLATDVIDTAHRTGVPPQFVRAHVDKESGGNRFAYRYEPIGPSVGDLFWASRGPNARVRDPYRLYRLATFADSANAALPQGTLLLAADRDPRASLRIGCDRNGNGGTMIGTGPTPANPTASEIFRCNDKTFPGRMNWSVKVGNEAEAKRRARLLRDDPFTAQTAIAASYGLLQVMFGRALDEGWRSADGSRNPSFLFDPPGAAAKGEGSLVAGAVIVRATLLARAKRLGAPFPPSSPDTLLMQFVPAWEKYNPRKGYAADVASRTLSFVPRPSVPVIAP